jgi:hypothetical protein
LAVEVAVSAFFCHMMTPCSMCMTFIDFVAATLSSLQCDHRSCLPVGLLQPPGCLLHPQHLLQGWCQMWQNWLLPGQSMHVRTLPRSNFEEVQEEVHIL